VPASTTRALDPVRTTVAPARRENVLVVSGTPHAPPATALYPKVDSSEDLWWASQPVAETGAYLAVVPRKLLPGLRADSGSSLLLVSTNGASAELGFRRDSELLTFATSITTQGVTLKVQGTRDVSVRDYPVITSESSHTALTLTFGSSQTLMFPHKGTGSGYWWKGPCTPSSAYTEAYTEVAVVAKQLGEWSLVGITRAGTACTLCAGLGQTPPNARWTASTVAPFTGHPKFDSTVFRSPVVAADPQPLTTAGACVEQQNTPAAQANKAAYRVTTTIPILKCKGDLVPYAQGNVTRWRATAALPTLASNSADSEIHVVDLRAEGIVVDAVPLSATWLICSVQGATYRGLVYSTEITDEPPTQGTWYSTWDMTSEVVTREIPTAALSIAVAYRVQPVIARFVSGTVTWNPVRLPHVDSKLELPFFISQTPSDEPDATLATGSDVSSAYVPEFFRAGVRWKYAGGTWSGKYYPDVYLQRLQTEDIPLAMQVQAGSTWVVYKHESTSQGVDVVAYTLSDSTGDSELPASTGWYGLYASQTRRLQFRPEKGSAVTQIRTAA
jgi:hypothetical protein